MLKFVSDLLSVIGNAVFNIGIIEGIENCVINLVLETRDRGYHISIDQESGEPIISNEVKN